MSHRLPLQLHPESRCNSLTGIDVEVGRLGMRRLLLRFFPTGNLRHVRFPSRGWTPPQRRDELWRHTCFEAFVRAGDSPAYYEFNLTASEDWAAYRFNGYRAGREIAKEVGKPGSDPVFFDPRDRNPPPPPTCAAVLDLDRLVDLPLGEPWHLGLSAVIEEKNGNKSYWALKHPPGAPDFHHPDCFALELPAARPA